MSTEYYFYLVEKRKDGKFYPLFETKDNFLKEVAALPTYYENTDFVSEYFSHLKKEDFSDELSKLLELEKRETNIMSCSLSDLRFRRNFIRSGYFLKKEVQMYLNPELEEEVRQNMIEEGIIFYDWIPAEVYAEKLKDDLIFGLPKNEEEPDEDNEEETSDNIKNSREYMFFCYPDFNSIEYFVNKLFVIAEPFRNENEIYILTENF